MCFNASLAAKAGLIQDVLGLSFPEDGFRLPVYFRSAFEFPAWPIVRQGESRRVSLARWGLIPRWAASPGKAQSIRRSTLNARAETIGVKPSFRDSVDGRRCGVLASGYVEWREYQGRKYPYLIYLENRHPFLIAGLWSPAPAANPSPSDDTFTVVTAEAKGISALVHNTKKRMPLILGEQGAALWLNPDLALANLPPEMPPAPAGITAHPVSSIVSRVGLDRNTEEAIRPWTYPELPPLDSREWRLVPP